MLLLQWDIWRFSNGLISKDAYGIGTHAQVLPKVDTWKPYNGCIRMAAPALVTLTDSLDFPIFVLNLPVTLQAARTGGRKSLWLLVSKVPFSQAVLVVEAESGSARS